MSIKIEINLNTNNDDRIDINYEAIPGENTSENEVMTANFILAVCNLMNDNEFIDALGRFAEKKIESMQKYQSSNKKGLIM